MFVLRFFCCIQNVLCGQCVLCIVCSMRVCGHLGYVVFLGYYVCFVAAGIQCVLRVVVCLSCDVCLSIKYVLCILEYT